jgi:hypothetical protein
MESRIPNVVVTRDGGHECWDTTVSAREISKAFAYGLLEVDPDRQRGKHSVTGKYIPEGREGRAVGSPAAGGYRHLRAAHVELPPGEFRREHSSRTPSTRPTARSSSATVGYLPDSVHRHYAIKKAVESVAQGSIFNPDRRFSLRIWNVPEEFENEIFYAMNMEHDKADATRSKWLAQKNVGQKIAAEVVRRSPHLGEANVETVTNTLSIRNPRLVAFNTLSSGFEEAWGDIQSEDVEKVASWFIDFWDKMVSVLPELGKLPLPQRQQSRKRSLVAWAIAIQGYIRLARQFYDDGHDTSLLKHLKEPQVEADGQTVPFFAWENPEFQRAGIIVPAVNNKGETRLTARNSHQTRRAMAKVLAKKVQLPVEPEARSATAQAAE